MYWETWSISRSATCWTCSPGRGLSLIHIFFKLYDFAGGYPSRRYARSDALQVADLRNLLGDAFGQIGLVVKPLHDIQTFVDAINLLDRQGDPPLEQTPAHRREGAIDHVCERALLARTVRREELQVADREFIDPNVILLVEMCIRDR